MAESKRSPMIDDTAEVNVRASLEKLKNIDEATGGWTVKTDARQTGCSMHIKFDNKTDVLTTLQFANMLQLAPGMLANALRLLLGEEQIVG